MMSIEIWCAQYFVELSRDSVEIPGQVGSQVGIL